jgi:hypothetical protein
MDFLWKSQRFGKNLEIFGSRTFSRYFYKSIDWYGFSDSFLVVALCLNYSLPPPPRTIVHAMLNKNRHNFANSFV